MTWHILLNAHAGQGKASEYCRELQVILDEASVGYVVHETQSAGDAGRIGTTILSATTDAAERTIAVVGGDGTFHELINGVYATLDHKINLVLVPSGTANAVYHSLFPSTCSSPTSFDRFLSVKAALSSSSSTSKLTPLSLLSVSAAGKHLYYSHVVTSTCLHAQLLETASSTEMRARYPGTERFQKAAEMHLGTVYQASLSLLPHPTRGVERWSSKTNQWEQVSMDRIDLEKEGFTYFVSSLVDRFEATFRITPHSSAIERPADTVDVLFVRAVHGSSKEQEAKRLFQILMAAYQDGEHLALTESHVTEGDLETSGKGEQVVEYYRVAGFEWQPSNADAEHVCVDGATFRLQDGETLRCLTDDARRGQNGFYVYV